MDVIIKTKSTLESVSDESFDLFLDRLFRHHDKRGMLTNALFQLMLSDYKHNEDNYTNTIWGYIAPIRDEEAKRNLEKEQSLKRIKNNNNNTNNESNDIKITTIEGQTSDIDTNINNNNKNKNNDDDTTNNDTNTTNNINTIADANTNNNNNTNEKHNKELSTELLTLQPKTLATFNHLSPEMIAICSSYLQSRDVVSLLKCNRHLCISIMHIHSSLTKFSDLNWLGDYAVNYGDFYANYQLQKINRFEKLKQLEINAKSYGDIYEMMTRNGGTWNWVWKKLDKLKFYGWSNKSWRELVINDIANMEIQHIEFGDIQSYESQLDDQALIKFISSNTNVQFLTLYDIVYKPPPHTHHQQTHQHTRTSPRSPSSPTSLNGAGTMILNGAGAGAATTINAAAQVPLHSTVAATTFIGGGSTNNATQQQNMMGSNGTTNANQSLFGPLVTNNNNNHNGNNGGNAMVSNAYFSNNNNNNNNHNNYGNNYGNYGNNGNMNTIMNQGLITGGNGGGNGGGNNNNNNWNNMTDTQTEQSMDILYASFEVFNMFDNIRGLKLDKVNSAMCNAIVYHLSTKLEVFHCTNCESSNLKINQFCYPNLKKLCISARNVQFIEDMIESTQQLEQVQIGVATTNKEEYKAFFSKLMWTQPNLEDVMCYCNDYNFASIDPILHVLENEKITRKNLKIRITEQGSIGFIEENIVRIADAINKCVKKDFQFIFTKSLYEIKDGENSIECMSKFNHLLDYLVHFYKYRGGLYRMVVSNQNNDFHGYDYGIANTEPFL